MASVRWENVLHSDPVWPTLTPWELEATKFGVAWGVSSSKDYSPQIEAVCLKSLCVFFYTQDWTILKELLKQPPKTFRLEVDKEIWYPLPNVNCDWTRPKSSAEETTKLCFLGLEYVYRLLYMIHIYMYLNWWYPDSWMDYFIGNPNLTCMFWGYHYFRIPPYYIYIHIIY